LALLRVELPRRLVRDLLLHAVKSMRALLLVAAVSACGSLYSSTPDAGPGDAGFDAGVDAGEFDAGFDAGICGGTPCTPELRVRGRVDPLDLKVNATDIYWLEYGLATNGLDGELNTIAKNQTCLDPDAGCVTDLNMDFFGRFRLESMALTPTDFCWIENYVQTRSVLCQGLVTHSLRTMAINQPYAAHLSYDGHDLLWVNQRGASSSDGDGGVARISANAAPGTAIDFVATTRPIPSTVIGLPSHWVWGEVGIGADAGMVIARPRDGGADVVLARGQKGPYAMVGEGAHVYWSDYGTRAIWSADLSALDAGIFAATNTDAIDLAIDADALFWVTEGTAPNYADGQLWRIARSGGVAKRLVAGIGITAALDVDEAHVYYIEMGTVTRLDGKIFRVPKDY
jgi:hypothetical protein